MDIERDIDRDTISQRDRDMKQRKGEINNV